MSEYLIDAKYVKENLNVSAATDDAAIKKSIKLVNRLYVEHLLGIPLLDYLHTTVNPAKVYANLVPDVKLYFGLLVQFDMLSTLGIKTTNKSNALVSDNTSDTASIKLEMKIIEDKAAHIKADILAYLNANALLIVEYIPQVSNFKFTGISFSKLNKKIIGG